MSASTNFAATPRCGIAKLIAADTGKDNPSTNVYTVLTAGALGSLVTRVYITLNGTTGSPSTVNVIRLWLNDGATNRLVCESAFLASTPSASVVGAAAVVVIPDLVLPTGYSLRATIHTCASAVDYYTVIAFGADF